MTAVVYARVSSDDQRERETIATQLERVHAFGDREGIKICDVYADDGVSGSIPLAQRPGGARLLRDAAEGRFSTVIVYRIDRLGRDTADGLLAVRTLDQLGVGVRSTTEAIDTSTPAGRFLLTMLFAAASYERDSIIQRSVDGANRLAREGAWLGGTPPYGYRVVGQKQQSRLAIDDELIGDLSLSKADVVREIFRLAADEGWTCRRIGEHLERMGVPCPGWHIGWEQPVDEKDRTRRTKSPANIWRPSRIRNLLISPTYRGEHYYGKRSKRTRDPVVRVVPPIVDPDTWERAQATLRRNLRFSPRAAKRQYLLRSLIRCGTCGLSFTGKGYPDHRGGVKIKYLCLGKHGLHGPYGARGERCPSLVIDGSIEDLIWSDIETFLRNPGTVLDELCRSSKRAVPSDDDLIARQRTLEQAIARQSVERDSVVALFRRGRIDEATLDRQLDDIDRQERDLRDELQQNQTHLNWVMDARSESQDVEHLLSRLKVALDSTLDWDVRRKLVELLVGGIRVDTVETDSVREAMVNVTYQFAPTTSRTDMPTCTARS